MNLKLFKFFAYLNNFLFVFIFILIFWGLNKNSFTVFSQQQQQIDPDNFKKGFKTINNEFKVSYQISDFTALYISDGITDEPSQNQKNKFYKKTLLTVPVGLNYKLNKEFSKLLTQSEVQFDAIPDIYAPIDHVCDNDDVDGCFNSVTSLSIFSNAVSTKLLSGLKDLKVNKSQNLILKLSSFIIEVYDQIDKGLGQVLLNAGIVDDQRRSVGLVSYWGDDNLQNIVPIEYNGRKTLVLYTKTETEKLGVNLSENSFAVDLSNTLKLETDNLVKRPALGLAISFGRIEYVGLNDIYDPYTKFIDNQEFNKFSSIVFRKFSDFIFKVTNINIGNNQLGVKKIAHEVPVRAINGSGFNFGLAYSLVEAVKKYHSDLPPYPNPLGYQPEFIIDPKTLKRYRNPLYENWLNYENLDIYIKKTLTFVDSNSDNKNEARDCALELTKDPGAGCDIFSVEESGFSLDIRGRIFPLGFNYNSWNSIFNQLNPQIRGPYVNPLSTSLCARLDLAFDVQPAESYVYRLSNANPKTNYVGKGTKATVVNSYCVVGAGLANFAKSLIAQRAYLGVRVQQRDTLPLDIKALTCDKKEQFVYNSAIYTYRNIPYSKLDYFSYLSVVSFSEPNSQKSISLSCNNNNNNCKQFAPLSFSVIKGNDVYGIQGFPFSNYSVLFTYAAPENDVQLILDWEGEKLNPKYIFFTASNFIPPEVSSADFNLARLVCKLVPQIDVQNTSSNVGCIAVTGNSWGFPHGSALKKLPVLVENANKITFFDLLILLYEEDNVLKYKYILIDPDDFNRNIILGDTNGYVLGKFDNFEVSTIQDNFGNLIVSMKETKDGLKIKVISLTIDQFDVRLTPDGKLVQSSFEPKVLNLVQNLCDHSDICKFYNDKFLGPLKLFVDYNDIVHIAGLTDGVGFVFRVNTKKEDQKAEAIIYSYVSKHSDRHDSYDEISAFRYEPKYDEYYIFTGRAGYFLHLIPINERKFEYLPSEACDDYKCYATIQQFFDPTQFLTDFSNYLGVPDSDGNTLEPIGWPIIKDFDLNFNGDIIGVYTYKSLSNLLIFSDDITYSFRGVYTKLTQNSNEASNVYIPSKTDLSPIPFRFFNIKKDGLLIGRDLIEKPDQSFREVIGLDVIGPSSNNNQNSMSLDNLHLVYNGYDRKNREEYLRCLYDYAYMRNSIDPFSFLSGVLPVPLNTTLIEDTNTSGGNSNSNSDSNNNNNSSSDTQNSNSENGDSGYSSINIGKYCEETWCIPDSFKLVNNPKYKYINDSNNNSSLPQAHHVDKLIEFLSKRKPNIASQYAQVVPKICLVAAERGIPCALLIAIWVQETGASIARESFGCFHPEMLSFELQYVCAANSIVNGYKEFYGIDGKSPIKERVGSGNRPNFRTEPEFTPSKCEAATAFSYIMQRYTPIDQRINVDNQCNRGLIIRNNEVRNGICIEDKDYFIKYTRIDDNGKEIRVVKIPPNNAWGEAISTRVNLKFVLEQFNNLVPPEDRIPITSNCFKSDAGNTGNNTDINNQGNNQGNNEVNAGIIKLNVAAWGNSYAAQTLAFAANRLEYGNTVNPSAPFEEGGRDINGVLGQKRKIIIPPKGLFSYNDNIGNGVNLPDFIKNPPKSNILPGIGWCDLATGIRLAAEKVIGPNSLKLKSVYLNEGPLGPDDQLKVPHGAGYGFGGDGDIFHWTHSTPMEASSSFYKKLLTPPKPNYGLDDYNKFVSIFTRPYDTKNDGDLIIRNPSDKYNLVLEVDYNSIDKTVTIKFTFGNP